MPRQVTPRTMRTQIVLQDKTETTNALGERVATWADDVTVWAESTPVRAREYVAAGMDRLPVEIVFRIRYRPGISASTHRVMWRGEAHDIRGEPIDVDGRRTTLELMCVKGLQHGD